MQYKKKPRNYKLTIMRTIILLLISIVFLTSCDDSVEEPVKEFTLNLPELLISKIYYNSKDLDSTYLIGDYTYDSTNNLIKRITYNPTSLLVSITQTYDYENGKVIRCDFSEVTAYNDNLDNPDTTKYYDLYSYDDNGYLISIQRYRGSTEPILTNFEYNNEGKIVKSYTGKIDTDICDSYSENDITAIDPILWTEYIYENDNAVSTFYIRCKNDSEIKMIFDNKNRPSDGLDYVPRTDLLPLISQYGYYSPSFSKGNVIDYGTLMIYEYEYNEKGFPQRIIPYYNGQELSDFEIEYKTLN